ncbi:helix-turn-helix transcriptional regulator [Phreatobacter sp.]|uniref:helix-turn-helix transcriptional regulator n=1 Tax=Phreatobacter sp. TaxID=1966341 RepID=UPI003F70A851
MSEPTLGTVMAAVDGLVAAAGDPAVLPGAVEDVRRLFSGSKACLARFGTDLDVGDAIATDVDPGLQRRISGDLKPDFQVLSAAIERVPFGLVYQLHSVAGREWLMNTRAFHEWFAPQDMYDGIACRLVGDPQSYWFFDVQRGKSQPRFDTAERDMLRLLSPVLTRTMEVRRHLGRVELDRDMARDTLDMLADGVVIVDRDLTIIHANDAAERLITAVRSALLTRRGRLAARQGDDQRALKAIVAETLLAHDSPLRRHSSSFVARAGGREQPALSICALPFAGLRYPGRVVIAIKPLSGRPDMTDHLARLFGLTPAEARLAGLLAAGTTVADAASTLAVRLSTVRTHLARLFQKTGTRQQSQLVALLNSVSPPFPAA